MKSITYSLEAKALEALRGMDLSVPCAGLLEACVEGEQKQEELSSLHVRCHNMKQLGENSKQFTADLEIRLNVEQSEDANGALFLQAHEAVALWLERIMLGSACSELDTERVYVDGLQRNGGSSDFEDGAWYADWNMTLWGRTKKEAS